MSENTSFASGSARVSTAKDGGEGEDEGDPDEVADGLGASPYMDFVLASALCAVFSFSGAQKIFVFCSSVCKGCSRHGFGGIFTWCGMFSSRLEGCGIVFVSNTLCVCGDVWSPVAGFSCETGTLLFLPCTRFGGLVLSIPEVGLGFIFFLDSSFCFLSHGMVARGSFEVILTPIEVELSLSYLPMSRCMERFGMVVFLSFCLGFFFLDCRTQVETQYFWFWYPSKTPWGGCGILEKPFFLCSFKG